MTKLELVIGRTLYTSERGFRHLNEEFAIPQVIVAEFVTHFLSHRSRRLTQDAK